MATQDETQSLYDRIAALRETVTSRLSSSLVTNPQLADVLVKQIDDLMNSAEAEDAKGPLPPDKGLAQLVGVGPEAATELGANRLPQGVQAYDETVTSERILAVGDLYYIYQHEKIGVFRVVKKLKELFRGGAVRLSTGEGSDVIRERAYDPSFGSIAIVRRAGLDLRNNMKFTSFGNLNVLRVEVMQLLDEAFRILNTDDIKRLFGADTAWDVIEDVLTRHFNENLQTSPRQRMGVTGREVLRWLSQPHILQTSRPQFEALLLNVAEHAEEWLTSAQSLGLAQRNQNGEGRVLPWDRPRLVSGAATRQRPQRAAAGGSRSAAQEY